MRSDWSVTNYGGNGSTSVSSAAITCRVGNLPYGSDGLYHAAYAGFRLRTTSAEEIKAIREFAAQNAKLYITYTIRWPYYNSSGYYWNMSPLMPSKTNGTYTKELSINSIINGDFICNGGSDTAGTYIQITNITIK